MQTETSSPQGVAKGTALRPVPAALGAILVGAGMAAPSDATAALIIQTLDETVSNGIFDFDLNQDGSDDFRISDNGPSSKTYIEVLAKGGFKGIKGGISKKGSFARQFASGGSVQASTFGSVATFRTDLYDGSSGPWGTVGATGFVGLQLEISGELHYGWVEITRGSTIVGQAGFQSTAGAAAQIPGVPEPASLGLLALGAAGLLGLRRRQRGAAADAAN